MIKILVLTIFTLITFQNVDEVVKIIGPDNYPIENWELRVSNKKYLSSINGEITVTKKDIDIYKNDTIKVVFLDQALIKKIYGIREESELEWYKI